MKYLYDFKKFILIILALAVFGAAAADARPTKSGLERYKAVISQILTERLRNELGDENIVVQLKTVQNQSGSRSRLDLSGSALAVVRSDKTELPLQFSAKVDLINRNVDDLSYEFVESIAEFAPSYLEDYLMKELMARIGRDHNTTNVVISIDGFETSKISSTQTKYQGNGEVRIGNFEWSKIKFDVVIDSQLNTASRILYDIQK